MQEKPFWASKTIWANGLALVSSLSLGFGLDVGLDPEAQAAILGGVMAIVNIALRFVTDSAVKV